MGVACAPRLPKTLPRGSTRARSRTGGSTRSSCVGHLLGVARRGGAWELLYLWYRVPGLAGEEHAAEVEDFAAVMRRDGVPFRACHVSVADRGRRGAGPAVGPGLGGVHDGAVPGGGDSAWLGFGKASRRRWAGPSTPLDGTWARRSRSVRDAGHTKRQAAGQMSSYLFTLSIPRNVRMGYEWRLRRQVIEHGCSCPVPVNVSPGSTSGRTARRRR